MQRLPLLKLACFMYKYKRLEAGQLPRENLSFFQNLLSENIWNKKSVTT